MDRVLQYIEKNQSRFLEELKEFLRIPSVSNNAENKRDVLRCAHYVVDQLRQIGMQQVEIFPTSGHPIVYGEWLGAQGQPTVLFYGHYDVQPVDPLDLWTSGPFEPTIRNGEIFARGSADDKGQVIMNLKGVESHLKSQGKLPINIKFLIEGEEEVGSANLDEFIASHKELLKADVVLISDTPMFDRGVPSICYGLRGLVYFQIDLKGTDSDLHSGSFGGTVINPNFALAQMIASLKNPDGQITIPGFYDDVQPMSPSEKVELSRLPFDPEKYRKSLGAPALFGEKGYNPLEQIWVRPTLEVNGICGGFIGEGAKTVIPAKAMAKISMRLVPNQDPERIANLFEAHIRRIAPSAVELTVTRMHGGKAWVAPIDHPAIQAASRAYEKGFGKRPVFVREGGSIPVVATFAEILGLPSVLMGIGLPDENAHAPNEKLDLYNFRYGIITSAHFFQEMAQ
ncbi:MAG: dipeptidase [Acidobacteria bacterium]|nr:MAG: dipeptidase [Acidobacteriota bacterium]